jgi:riboflavin synthase
VFTGIITATANVRSVQTRADGLLLSFERPKSWTDLVLGESIATNGACLTVSAMRANEYDCFLLTETLSKTVFGQTVPKRVSLERSLQVSDRFGGHFVSGHVDGLGTVTRIDHSDGLTLSIEFAEENLSLVIYKGSICINGVSLTVSSVQHSIFTVSLIPHTLTHTTLEDLQTGDQVNLEFDMIGKYISQILESRISSATS